MIYSIPAGILIVGIMLIIPAVDQPRFADPNWQEEFLHADSSAGWDRLSLRFYAAYDSNLSTAARRSDLGVVVTSLGVSIAALFGGLRVQDFRDLREMKTPSSGKAMRWITSTAWWSWVPAQMVWFSYTHARGDYPWWSDSIAIPIGGAFLWCLIGFPLVLWVVHLALRGGKLPVRLARVPRAHRGLVATVLACIPLAWFLLIGIRAFSEGDPFSVPVAVVGIYATASLWAVGCSPRVA